MVGAGDPEGGVAGHAVPAGEDVHLGLVEHVPHVEATGDVGWREEHGELPGAGLRILGRRHIEELFAGPVLGPFFLDGGWIVGFGKIVGFRNFFAHGNGFKGSIAGVGGCR